MFNAYRFYIINVFRKVGYYIPWIIFTLLVTLFRTAFRIGFFATTTKPIRLFDSGVEAILTNGNSILFMAILGIITYLATFKKTAKDNSDVLFVSKGYGKTIFYFSKIFVMITLLMPMVVLPFLINIIVVPSIQNIDYVNDNVIYIVLEFLSGILLVLFIISASLLIHFFTPVTRKGKIIATIFGISFGAFYILDVSTKVVSSVFLAGMDIRDVNSYHNKEPIKYSSAYHQIKDDQLKNYEMANTLKRVNTIINPFAWMAYIETAFVKKQEQHYEKRDLNKYVKDDILVRFNNGYISMYRAKEFIKSYKTFSPSPLYKQLISKLNKNLTKSYKTQTISYLYNLLNRDNKLLSLNSFYVEEENNKTIITYNLTLDQDKYYTVQINNKLNEKITKQDIDNFLDKNAVNIVYDIFYNYSSIPNNIFDSSSNFADDTGIYFVSLDGSIFINKREYDYIVVWLLFSLSCLLSIAGGLVRGRKLNLI